MEKEELILIAIYATTPEINLWYNTVRLSNPCLPCGFDLRSISHQWQRPLQYTPQSPDSSSLSLSEGSAVNIFTHRVSDTFPDMFLCTQHHSCHQSTLPAHII